MSRLKDLARALMKAAWWVGVVTVILGIAAIFAPIVVGATVVVLVGLVLLVAGVAITLLGWHARDEGRGSWGLILGALAALCGLILVLQPTSGMWIARWVALAWLIVAGVSELALAFQVRPDEGWVWVLGGGVVALVCATSLAVDWPFSGPRAIGVLVGINLISGGVAVIQVHRTLERLGEGASNLRERLADR